MAKSPKNPNLTIASSTEIQLARTITDLVESDNIEANHLSEAIGYRKLDRRS
ncbi:MAG: hypothetical protein EXR90_01455 [Methyloglobulus sp.]|nr:hypothetical protein [Methyloglobulus sp.]